jgi:hypothetical protein
VAFRNALENPDEVMVDPLPLSFVADYNPVDSILA